MTRNFRSAQQEYYEWAGQCPSPYDNIKHGDFNDPNWWIIYDVPNEQMYNLTKDTILTDRDIKRGVVVIPYSQAKNIAGAKGLPHPPIPEVIHGQDN